MYGVQSVFLAGFVELGCLFGWEVWDYDSTYSAFFTVFHEFFNSAVEDQVVVCHDGVWHVVGEFFCEFEE